MTRHTHDDGSTDNHPTPSARSSWKSRLQSLLPDGRRLAAGQTAPSRLLVSAGLALAVLVTAVTAGTGGAAAAIAEPGETGELAPTQDGSQLDDSLAVQNDSLRAEIVGMNEEYITVAVQYPNGNTFDEAEFTQETSAGRVKLTPPLISPGDEGVATSSGATAWPAPDHPLIFPGEQGIVEDIYLPQHVSAGDEGVATPVEVGKVTQDDGIGYFGIFRTEDVAQSATSGEELSVAMLVYPPNLNAKGSSVSSAAGIPVEPKVKTSGASGEADLLVIEHPDSGVMMGWGLGVNQAQDPAPEDAVDQILRDRLSGNQEQAPAETGSQPERYPGSIVGTTQPQIP